VEINLCNKNHLQAGDRIKRKRLAKTLRLIADEGIDTFYNGSMADQLVEEIRKFNGIITKEDFQAYK
jgi:gamma-glutamyltranspeptidase